MRWWIRWEVINQVLKLMGDIQPIVLNCYEQVESILSSIQAMHSKTKRQEALKIQISTLIY
jgi:hypothetical protein